MKLNSALEKEDSEPFDTILHKNIRFKNRHMRNGFMVISAETDI
jgi:hypothetical protein